MSKLQNQSLYQLIQKRYKSVAHVLTKIQVIILVYGASAEEIAKVNKYFSWADEVILINNDNGLRSAFREAEGRRCRKRGWATLLTDWDVKPLRNRVENPETDKGYSEVSLYRDDAREAVMEDINRVFYKENCHYASYEPYMQGGAKPYLVEILKGITGGMRFYPNWVSGWVLEGITEGRQLDMAISNQKQAKGFKIARFQHRTWTNKTLNRYPVEGLPNEVMGRAGSSVLRVNNREEASTYFDPFWESRET